MITLPTTFDAVQSKIESNRQFLCYGKLIRGGDYFLSLTEGYLVVNLLKLYNLSFLYPSVGIGNDHTLHF